MIGPKVAMSGDRLSEGASLQPRDEASVSTARTLRVRKANQTPEMA